MTTIEAIDKYISSLAPTEYRESWDNDGVMLCGSKDAEVKSAVVCLEVSLEAIKYAIEVGAQLIITHHPFIFRPLKSVTGTSFSELELLVKNGISVLSYHTRLDKAAGGVNDVLAQTIGLENISVGADSFLRTGTLKAEMTAEEFAEHLKTVLGCESMRVYFEKGKSIRTVSVCGGAGKEFLYEAAAISDAYVSADLAHNTFIDAKALGIALYDAGHYHTENPTVKRLVSILKSEFPTVSFCDFDVGCPFFNV